MTPIRYQDPLSHIRQTFLLEIYQLFEEGWNVNDHARSDQVRAGRIYETGGEEMEVVCDAVRNDGVASIVTSG